MKFVLKASVAGLLPAGVAHVTLAGPTVYIPLGTANSVIAGAIGST